MALFPSLEIGVGINEKMSNTKIAGDDASPMNEQSTNEGSRDREQSLAG